MKIALTGGIACGKSLFTRYLNQLGVDTIDADDIVHELEGVNGEAVPLIAKEFGSDVLEENGSVNRHALAQKVFSGEDSSVKRKILESILFPLVHKKIDDFFVLGGPLKIAIIPLLFESHWEGEYDIIISLISPHHIMIKRMMENRGYSSQEALARISAQLPITEKSNRSHYTIVNDSTEEKLFAEAKKLVDWLIERTNHGKQ